MLCEGEGSPGRQGTPNSGATRAHPESLPPLPPLSLYLCLSLSSLYLALGCGAVRNAVLLLLYVAGTDTRAAEPYNETTFTVEVKVEAECSANSACYARVSETNTKRCTALLFRACRPNFLLARDKGSQPLTWFTRRTRRTQPFSLS